MREMKKQINWQKRVKQIQRNVKQTTFIHSAMCDVKRIIKKQFEEGIIKRTYVRPHVHPYSIRNLKSSQIHMLHMLHNTSYNQITQYTMCITHTMTTILYQIQGPSFGSLYGSYL